MDMEKAEKAVRNGAIAGFIVAGMTTLIFMLAMSGVGDGALDYWNDPLLFIDIVLAAGLSFGLLFRSRTCAILLFAYFLISKLVLIAETGQFQGIVLALVMLYFFGQAIRGTFAWHRIRQKEDPDYKPTGKLGYILMFSGILVGFLTLGLIVLSLLGPPTYVVDGIDLDQSDREILLAEGLIDPAEDILMYYSAGLFSIREDGSILTDRRVISYEETEDGLWVGAAPFGDIRKVEVVEQGDLLNDTTTLVTLYDGAQFYLVLSAENDGDKRFITELEKRLR